MDKNIFFRIVLMSMVLWFGLSYSMDTDEPVAVQFGARTWWLQYLEQNEAKIFAGKTEAEKFSIATQLRDSASNRVWAIWRLRFDAIKQYDNPDLVRGNTYILPAYLARWKRMVQVRREFLRSTELYSSGSSL